MSVFILLILFSPLSVIILCYVLYHLSIPSKFYLDVCIFVCCPHSSKTPHKSEQWEYTVVKVIYLEVEEVVSLRV